MTTISDWDWQAVSRGFFKVAQEAYRYASDCRANIAADPGNQKIHDGH